MSPREPLDDDDAMELEGEYEDDEAVEQEEEEEEEEDDAGAVIDAAEAADDAPEVAGRVPPRGSSSAPPGVRQYPPRGSSSAETSAFAIRRLSRSWARGTMRTRPPPQQSWRPPIGLNAS